MKLDSEEAYERFINGDLLFNDKGDFDEDDYETFTTSEDLAKRNEKIEKKFGDQAPANDAECDEYLHFNTYTKTRQHKYTEQEMNDIRESCKGVIVHDYSENDRYHMSDEELAECDMLSEISMKLGCLKHSYNKVNEYIDAMRTVVKAWEILEKQNYVHTRDEFYELVAEGRIVCNRIIMPKLRKANQYNMDLIIKYISNPELDSKDLLTKKVEKDFNDDDFYIDSDSDDLTKEEKKYNEYYNSYVELLQAKIQKIKEDNENEDGEDDESYESDFNIYEEAEKYAKERMREDEMYRVLKPEDVQFVIDNADNPPRMETHTINRKYVKGYDTRLFRSKKKKMKKKEKYTRDSLHSMLNQIQNNHKFDNDSLYDRSYTIANGMFDIDKKEEYDFFDGKEYHGSWRDKDALLMYNLMLTEEAMKEHPPKERYATYADKELDKFFRDLEDAGVNVVDIRRRMDCSIEDDGTTKEDIKRRKKENKKIESSLLQRITELNNNPKFKKIASKAENALNKYMGE